MASVLILVMKGKEVESSERLGGGRVWQAEHVQEFVDHSSRMLGVTVSAFKKEKSGEISRK